jgi:hypothetical protein
MPTFYDPHSNHRIIGSTTKQLPVIWNTHSVTVCYLEKSDQLSDYSYITENETCAEHTDEKVKL